MQAMGTFVALDGLLRATEIYSMCLVNLTRMTLAAGYVADTTELMRVEENRWAKAYSSSRKHHQTSTRGMAEGIESTECLLLGVIWNTHNHYLRLTCRLPRRLKTHLPLQTSVAPPLSC